MSDARWNDPRECGQRDRDDERPRVYDDRDEHDPRDGLMHDLDLPRGEERVTICWFRKDSSTPGENRD